MNSDKVYPAAKANTLTIPTILRNILFYDTPVVSHLQIIILKPLSIEL